MEHAAARHHLLEIYASALQAVAGDRLVREYLEHSLTTETTLCVVAIGKAAEAMAMGAQQALGERIQRGLLITKHGYLSQTFDRRWECIEAGHPLPDSDSLFAGQRLLDFLHTIPDEAQLLFLISGGTSALVEVLPTGVSLASLHQVNDWLLASGLDIAAMNRVRKRLSVIKAGRLAAALRGQRVTQLLISDVPGSDPRVIGSGLLVQHTAEDLDTEILHLPDRLITLLQRAPMLTEPHAFADITTHVLANNHTARLAAQREAQQRGLAVMLHDEDFQGDALQLGQSYARTIIESPAALHIWGGEASVKLPAHPGRGGRCQQLALAAAMQLAGGNGLLLAAGTDGSDGPGEDAGALVDGKTVERGTLEGFSAPQALHAADAGSFLEATGDLLQTGPTGSNVMDLVLGLNPG